MRESYYMKIHKLHLEGKISTEYANELIKEHKEKLEKRRRYKRGETIATLDELLEQTYVFWFGRLMHIEAVKCWQLRSIIKGLSAECFYKAVDKFSESEGKNE